MKQCKFCGKDFEPKSAKAIFCSTNCRVKYSVNASKKNPNLTPLQISLGDLADKVTTADQIPYTAKRIQEEADKTGNEWNKKNPNTIFDADRINARIKELEEDAELATRLKAFCKQFKTNPDDLFSWLMDNYGKPKKQAKIEDKGAKTGISSKSDTERPTRSNFMVDLRKKKLGL